MANDMQQSTVVLWEGIGVNIESFFRQLLTLQNWYWFGIVSYVLNNNQSSVAKVWVHFEHTTTNIAMKYHFNVWSAYVDPRGTNLFMGTGRTLSCGFYIHTNKVSMWEDTKCPIKQINIHIVSIEHQSVPSISFAVDMHLFCLWYVLFSLCYFFAHRLRDETDRGGLLKKRSLRRNLVRTLH